VGQVMFKYSFWRNILKIVYLFEWWTARSVNHVESKFFQAEIDYHAQYDSWNDVIEYIHNVDNGEQEEENDCL
jgi:hypothetical protein